MGQDQSQNQTQNSADGSSLVPSFQDQLPGTWQYSLVYDASKLSKSYLSMRALLDARVAAMEDNDYKVNFVALYEHTLQLQTMGYSDPEYKTVFDADVENKHELISWYQQRDEMVGGHRKYTTTRPESEKWLMDLAAFMGDIHKAKRYPDDGPSQKAAALLEQARVLRTEYDEHKDAAYYNDPRNNYSMLSSAQALYSELIYQSAQGNSPSTDAALKDAMGQLDLILRDLGGRTVEDIDTEPIDFTDDEALKYERFPRVEHWWVNLSFKNDLPEKLSAAFKAMREIKLFSMDNSGIVISFIVNALFGGISPAAIAAGITEAYKVYYKEKGTGPLADMSARILLPQAASDSRFMDSIKAGKTLLSDMDYAALLLLQAKLAGKMTVLGTLAGYGGAKLLSDFWDAITSIPMLGWLLDWLGKDVKLKFNDLSTSATSGFL